MHRNINENKSKNDKFLDLFSFSIARITRIHIV